MPKGNIWTTTTNRYLAFIDIMGFKDMVLRASHNEIYEMMKKINKVRAHVENVNWLNSNDKLAKTITFSDSIIIYSKNSSFKSFDFLISTVAGLSYYLFTEGIPHKGAVAFGKMTIDLENSIFFGQPLIDSYLLQEEVHFYGILFHASAEQKLLNKPRAPFTANYLCNLKGGAAKHLTIYPMYARQTDDAKFRNEYTKLISSAKDLRLKTSGHLRKYIDNTEIYLEAVANMPWE